MNTPAPGLPGLPGDPPRTGHRSRRPLRLLGTAAAAAGCLAVAVVAGQTARAEQVSKPTPAEVSAAAAAAVAQRWLSWPTGRIFPAALGYGTSLGTRETALRVGIAPQTACPAGLDAGLARPAARAGCRAVLRASYVDQLQGVVYTVGVVAFPTGRRAAGFAGVLAGQGPGGAGLRGLGFPGTASAAFSDPARQASAERQQGPYVVVTVAGYADGRPAAATAQRQPAVFAPAEQLTAEVIAPLTAPAVVSCHSQQFTC